MTEVEDGNDPSGVAMHQAPADREGNRSDSHT